LQFSGHKKIVDDLLEDEFQKNLKAEFQKNLKASGRRKATLQQFFRLCCNSQGGWATVGARIPFTHSSSNMLHPNSNKNAASPHCHITHQSTNCHLVCLS